MSGVLPNPQRMNELAELYQRLCDDLAAKPMPEDGSLPPDSDRPVVWYLHQKIRAYTGVKESGGDTSVLQAEIVNLLRGFMGDPAFAFDAPEIEALGRLMVDSKNGPLAPYSPYAADEVHASVW